MKIYNLDFSHNLMRCILWQYNDAEKLQALIRAEADFYGLETETFWQNWYRDVFNLDTATDFGLIVWAIILGVSQKIKLEAESPKRILGFNTIKNDVFVNSNENFNYANFASSESVISLNRTQLRMLLKIRAMQLVSNGSTYDINRILNRIFLDNIVFCRDNYDMTMTYVFSEAPESDVIFLLQRADVFRPPAAVGYDVHIFSAQTWGFGPHRRNFNRGNFFHFTMKF